MGRVKSFPRKGAKGVKLLKQHVVKKTKKDRYLRVCLSKNRISKWILVHRLVAEAFIPKPKNKQQVNHIDGDKQNNNAENLEWCTQSENMKHAQDIGLKRPSRLGVFGKDNPCSKSVYQIDRNTGEIINKFYSITEASKELGTTGSGIIRCCKGKQEISKGFKWRYQMKYIISNNIRIQNPTDEMKDYVEENLVIENPQYNQLKRLGKWTGNVSRHLVWYEIDGNDLIVPFGFIDMLWKIDRDIGNYENRIKLGKRLTYKSKIKLFDYQEEVVKKAINKKNGRHNNASRFW